MIYVQHLLGVGHLQRAQQLAAALLHRGCTVELVSGGMSSATQYPPAIHFHQLPPARCADASFSHLLDADGNEVNERWCEARRTRLLELFEQLRPQALITETFPFGRRMMRFELLPLLERARGSEHCRLVISSIRDILQPKSKTGRNRETCELIKNYYDHVIVHGDSTISRLEDSFAAAAEIDSKIYYSGYISQASSTAGDRVEPGGEILVSAGGSDTGLQILQTAIAAKPLCSLRPKPWRILVSPAIGESAFEHLQQLADESTIVERNRPDFHSLMQGAELSISQAGYNTITDILGSRTSAVVIPFAAAGEIEQTLRAQNLQARGRLVMLEQDQLSATNLAAAVERALQLETRLTVDLDGAANSATAITGWLQASKP